MVTIKQIAKEAGVSTMTVSNVINHKTNKVSLDTKERIEALIEQYDYTPNLNARSLVSSESKLIALIEYAETNNDAHISFNEPFLAELLAGIDQRVTEKHYFTIIRRVTSVDEITVLRKNWNLAGAIVVGLNQKYFKKLMTSLNVPTVFVDSYIDKKNIDTVFKRLHRSMCLVNSDDYDGSYQATNFLIQQGRRQVGFLGYEYNAPGVVSERLDGYKQALADNELALDERLVFKIRNPDTDAFQKLGNLVLDRKLDALVVTSDLVACQLISSLNMKLKIPQDLAVVGFDNMYFSRWMTPPLTTISQDIQRQGKVAVDFLVKAKENKGSQVEFVNLPVKLIKRETTD